MKEADICVLQCRSAVFDIGATEQNSLSGVNAATLLAMLYSVHI